MYCRGVERKKLRWVDRGCEWLRNVHGGRVRFAGAADAEGAAEVADDDEAESPSEGVATSEGRGTGGRGI